MTLTATNSYVNWSSFTFTIPGSPSNTVLTLDKVEDIQFDGDESIIEFEGDNAPGPTDMKLVKQKRLLTVTSADEKGLLAIPRGVYGTLTVKREDSINGAAVGGGGYLVTLSSCMAYKPKSGGKHAEYGKGTVIFGAIWTWDNTNHVWVDPLAITDL